MLWEWDLTVLHVFFLSFYATLKYKVWCECACGTHSRRCATCKQLGIGSLLHTKYNNNIITQQQKPIVKMKLVCTTDLPMSITFEVLYLKQSNVLIKLLEMIWKFSLPGIIKWRKLCTQSKMNTGVLKYIQLVAHNMHHSKKSSKISSSSWYAHISRTSFAYFSFSLCFLTPHTHYCCCCFLLGRLFFLSLAHIAQDLAWPN